MVLHYAIKVHQLAVDLIQHLDLGRCGPLEEKRRAAREGLDVAIVSEEKRKNAIGQATLAAQPWND